MKHDVLLAFRRLLPVHELLLRQIDDGKLRTQLISRLRLLLLRSVPFGRLRRPLIGRIVARHIRHVLEPLLLLRARRLRVIFARCATAYGDGRQRARQRRNAYLARGDASPCHRPLLAVPQLLIRNQDTLAAMPRQGPYLAE